MKHASSMTIDEKDYVLGTHEKELARLGLQHRVWRPRALDAWQKAGFNAGQTLIDVGCGPGYATIDLAEIVGQKGKIIAIDRSRRFLDHLETERDRRGLTQIETIEAELDDATLPTLDADGAWARWVFAFVQDPRRLLAQVADALAPGATLVIHEYFDYGSWRLAPRLPELESFVQIVMDTWRASGGEPDIALELPEWLAELGFRMQSVRPIVHAVPPSNFIWQWPASFVGVNAERLVELGRITVDEGLRIVNALSRAEQNPATLMITPGVLEMIAVKKA